MNGLTSIKNFPILPLKEAFTGFSHIFKNRIVQIAIAAIGLLVLAIAVTHLIHFKAEAPKAIDDQPKDDLHDQFQMALGTLKEGYAVIPLFKPEVTQSLFKDLQTFHAQPETYKQQFVVKDQIENGYATLKNKNVFVVRNQQQVPVELKNFIPYISNVHDISIKILKQIESELNLDPGQLTQAAAHDPLPQIENSTSLLRLFAYDPSNEEGVAADAHQDLGLLTIIPCSSVPALEVLDIKNDCQWLNLENKAGASHAIVLVGRTLEQMTDGKYQAGMHRVTNSPNKRFSIVYQLRAEPQTLIPVSGGLMQVDAWLTQLKRNLTSINGSY